MWKPVERLKQEKVSSVAMVILTCLIALFSFIVACESIHQATIYREATHADLRAYLFSDRNEYGTGYFSREQTVRIFFRNYGHTPAFNPGIRYVVRTFAEEFPNSPPYATRTDTIPDVAVGGDKETGFSFSPFKDLTDSTQQSLVSRKAAMYIYGTVRYEDVFHERYCLRFCFRLDPTNGATKLFAYGRYNREEKDCGEKD